MVFARRRRGERTRLRARGGEISEKGLVKPVADRGPADDWPSRVASKFGAPAWVPLAAGLFLACVLCDLDKVNLSIAVMPISKQFGLSETDVGVASSAFFWGYMLTQLPAAWIFNRVPGGPAVALTAGVFVQSVGTVITASVSGLPADLRWAALPLLCASRCLVGLGEGIGCPAVGALIAPLPTEERSSATSFAYSGSTMGAALGLLLCPFLIDVFDWPFVFLLFAALGLIWCVGWAATYNSVVAKQPPAARDDLDSLPLVEILSSPSVWVLIGTHAMSNVAFYSLLAWVPSFYTRGLGIGFEEAGALSFLPYLGSTIAAPVVGTAADALLRDGWEVRNVRKLFQGLGLLGPAACIAVLAVKGAALGTVASVALLVLAQTLHTCNRAGLFCSHADLSPRYAGFLLALSTTAGAISPIAVIPIIGSLVDSTGSFALGVFVPVAAAYVLGAFIFLLASSHKREAFNEL